jgi:hypothetical protein
MDIEKLDNQSRHKASGKPKIAAPPADDGFEPWYQHRPSGRLWEFCEQIGRFRREGKNRRDTSTVANRVLRLAQVAAQWEFGVKKASKPKPTASVARLKL